MSKPRLGVVGRRELFPTGEEANRGGVGLAAGGG